MTTHELKVWPEFFAKLKTGEKMFELRRNDRDYKVGDKLILREWSSTQGKYLGGVVEHEIAYIMDGRDVSSTIIGGLASDFIIIGFKVQLPEISS